MLAAVGLLSAQEAEQIITALGEIEQDIATGRLVWRAELEDIHTHIEQALIARLGDIGGKLHTARSRNDQVVTDMKLWIREAIDKVDQRLVQLQRAFVAFAEREHEVILPGYTHLQRAQPVLASHYALAYVEKFERDRARLADARRRVNTLPLGAAALAGTSLPIDREHVRVELGFASLAANSLDISSDRDFVLDYLYALAVLAVHLSGWAEEWILWSTTEFSFLELPDPFCTGSSIMPHKKNPDVLELIRGRSARVLAALQQLLILLKGLPLAYNRDLQEDKAALFPAHDTVIGCLEVAIPLIEGSRLRRDVIAARLDDGFLDATTLMEGLVELGLPLRTAHEAVGRLVRECEARRCRLADLPDDTFHALVPQQPNAAEHLRSRLGVSRALAAFRSVGSTAPQEVQRQLHYWKQRLGGDNSSQRPQD
jgi:argininosuccinate lyase